MDDESRGGSRDSARQPIELRVEYKRLNSFFSDYLKNISKGGTFIRTTKPLDVGTEFIFKLHVPSLDEPLRILGRVQWVVTQDEVDAGDRRSPGEPGMGIRFVFADPEEQAEIERSVEKVMIDSLGQRLYAKLMEYSRSGTDGRKHARPFGGLSESFAAVRGLSMDPEDGALRRKPDTDSGGG